MVTRAEAQAWTFDLLRRLQFLQSAHRQRYGAYFSIPSIGSEDGVELGDRDLGARRRASPVAFVRRRPAEGETALPTDRSYEVVDTWARLKAFATLLKRDIPLGDLERPPGRVSVEAYCGGGPRGQIDPTWSRAMRDDEHGLQWQGYRAVLLVQTSDRGRGMVSAVGQDPLERWPAGVTWEGGRR